MRRILRRSRRDAGRTTSGSRRRPEGRSVSIQSDDEGIGASIEGPPEPDEALRRPRVETNQRPTSTRSQRSGVALLRPRSDSGCCVGADTTEVRQWDVLERQDEVLSSVTTSSSTSLARFHRQLSSLRSFRQRSEQFLRHRMRPSCLRRRIDDDDDDAYHPAAPRQFSDGGAAAVDGWLPWMPTAAPSRSQHSSRSDVTNPFSSVDVPAWTDRGYSPESSAFFSLAHHQVGVPLCRCCRSKVILKTIYVYKSSADAEVGDLVESQRIQRIQKQ